MGRERERERESSRNVYRCHSISNKSVNGVSFRCPVLVELSRFSGLCRSVRVEGPLRRSSAQLGAPSPEDGGGADAMCGRFSAGVEFASAGDTCIVRADRGWRERENETQGQGRQSSS